MPSSKSSGSFHAHLRACLSLLPHDVAAVRERLSSLDDTEWQPFLDYMASHGVLAVMAPAIDERLLPATVVADLQRRLMVQAMWSQQVGDVLAACLSDLTAAGVQACALKGPVLAERIYDAVTDRSSIDVDVLVRPAQLQQASDVLTREGYRGDSDLAVSYLIEHSHHLHFSRPATPDVELHFQAYHGFGTVVPASALLDRATPHLFGGHVPTIVPSPEDELIYLAAHAGGHSFIRLLWLFDLKQLIGRHAIDWALVFERSRTWGVSNVVAYALHLLREWLRVQDVPAWPARMPAVRKWVADRLIDVVAAPSVPSAVDNLGGLAFTAALCDRASASGALVGHHLARAMKHRAHRAAPSLVPDSWSA